MNERTTQDQTRYPQIHIIDISPEHVHLADRPGQAEPASRQQGGFAEFVSSLRTAVVERGLFVPSFIPDPIIANGL
jgi:hypothetical protein